MHFDIKQELFYELKAIKARKKLLQKVDNIEL